MQSYLFPDNTVFVNFAWVDRLELLRRYLGDRGILVEAVQYEIESSKQFVPNLHKVDSTKWFAEILEFGGDADVAAIELMRRARFGGDEAQPLKHLGESQAIHAVSTIDRFRGSVIVTDDRAAYHLAKGMGCLVAHSVDVLRALVARLEMTPQQAFELTVKIRDAGRDGRKLLETVTSTRDFE